jgi:hypothetical protein
MSGNNEQGNFEKAGESMGELAGRVAGQMADRAMEMTGTAFNSLTSAMGSWWSGQDAQRAASSFTDDHDRKCRSHYESTAPRRSGHHYETSRPFYQMGHVARHNPDYRGRSFSEVEPDLQRQWESGPGRQHGTWPEVRDYVGYSFESSADSARGSSEMHGEANIGNTHVSGSVNMQGKTDNTR